MNTVLVTGGTGHLGRDLVTRLKGSFQVRVLARSPGSDPDVEWIRGDLATGEGIADALAGSQTVIHAATLSPAARRGYILPKDLWSSPPEVDRDGTTRLLDHAAAAGVGALVLGHSAVDVVREVDRLVRSGQEGWKVRDV